MGAVSEKGLKTARSFYDQPMRLGIDLGGTKVELAALLPDGVEAGRLRVETPAGDYDGILSVIARKVVEAEGMWGPAASIGIGTPGAIDPATGLLKNSNSVALNGRPLRRDLERALGRDIRIANDADCFALSEASDGAGDGASVVFGVILGTGVGGGVVVRRRLLGGPNAIAGEWGHNPLPWPDKSELPGPSCYCGRNGCIETFLSGPGLVQDHRFHTGTELAPSEIARAAAAGEAAPSETMDRYVDRLGRSLATVINLLDPDVIVLGGGVSNIDSLYDAVPAVWDDYIFSGGALTRLVHAQHGDSSGVRGAARL